MNHRATVHLTEGSFTQLGFYLVCRSRGSLEATRRVDGAPQSCKLEGLTLVPDDVASLQDQVAIWILKVMGFIIDKDITLLHPLQSGRE